MTVRFASFSGQVGQEVQNDDFKTVLVAGGAGFLGSRICEILIGQGHQVICLDNLQTGALGNITQLMQSPNFTFLQKDVIQPLAIAGPVDEIYNMACAASPPKYQMDPIHTFKTNVWGTMNLLELAREKNARILQASTSEVYGDPTESLQSEDYWGNVNTYGPRSCYDEGKRAAETLLHDFRQQYGLQTRIARIFNTYGPNMNPEDGRVVSNFIVQALKGEDITIYGSGQQTRSFCYRDDTVAGLMGLMAADDSASAPVNIGNPIEMTMLELATVVIEKTGAKVALALHPLPQDDPQQRRPDISRAYDCIGWKPEVSLSDGLDKTIAYFREALSEAPESYALGAAQ